ncbi:unannotated protein [freshwater metagenome]|uniref:Unannotated protein n=1 Tax=freshwater metagenome TaxID=449393 RepID=A0A6J7L6V4_9ZZZZ
MVTGQSLPNETVAPESTRVFMRYWRLVRSSPSLGAVNSVCQESNFAQ